MTTPDLAPQIFEAQARGDGEAIDRLIHQQRVMQDGHALGVHAQKLQARQTEEQQERDRQQQREQARPAGHARADKPTHEIEPPKESAGDKLRAAVARGDQDGIKAACDAGARLTDRGADGRSALRMAAEAGHTESIQTILENAPVGDLVRERAEIALCGVAAAKAGHGKTLEALLETGAINTQGIAQIRHEATGPAVALMASRPEISTPAPTVARGPAIPGPVLSL